jgi:hypothetical protein
MKRILTEVTIAHYPGNRRMVLKKATKTANRTVGFQAKIQYLALIITFGHARPKIPTP